MTIETRLFVDAAKADAGGHHLSFEATNTSERDILVLPWHTPLEGLLSDCLVVYRDGVEVAYDGPLAKRRAPIADDLLRIPAGETVSRTVDLSSAYEVSGPATYRVELRPWRGRVVDDAETLALDETSEATWLVAAPPVAEAVEFSVGVAGPVAPTAGLLARAREKQAKGLLAGPSTSPGIGAPKTPIITGGSASHQSQAQQAHVNGYNLAVQAKAGLANDAHYVRWFGSYDQTRFTAVKTVYDKITLGMETQTLTYNLTGTGCQANWYAYTYKGATTVWLCGAFWNAPATGTDSQAGTVVHEWSHALANTDDIAYGQTACLQLAKDHPSQAVRNADSFEYYAGG